MKHLNTVLASALMVLSQGVMACDTPSSTSLDKISFQVSARQWVSTQTALLQVNVNMTLKQEGMVQARNAIMTHLNQIAKGEWHITQFNRSQDNSGLDKLFVQAQARVPQAMLTEVYKQAKSVSQPGANYQIAAIEFKPSLEEVQAAKDTLRQTLYQNVNKELARLNEVYTAQHYTVNQLTITEGGNENMPRPYMAKEMSLAAQAPAPLAVSNELTLTAVVEAASNRLAAPHDPKHG